MRWFYDDLPGFRLGFKTKKRIFNKQSKFQRIRVFETDDWGRVLTLDSAIQTTELDEFIYHEMIAHVPLFLHPNPKSVLIIGDPDGGILREVLHHKVKRVILVDNDEGVIYAAKKYLSKIHSGSFYDRRVRVLVSNGAEFIKNFKKEFDVIIVGSIDSVSKKFCQDVAAALADKGIMAAQLGGIFSSWNEFRSAFQNIKKSFPKAAPFISAIPTRPSALWGLVVASKQISFDKQPRAKIRQRYERMKSQLKYYNPELHQAAFALPVFIKTALKENKKSLL